MVNRVRLPQLLGLQSEKKTITKEKLLLSLRAARGVFELPLSEEGFSPFSRNLLPCLVSSIDCLMSEPARS